MNFLGHLCRLHEDTPARKALKESFRIVKKKKGGQKMTWIKYITKDLAAASINLDLKKPTETLNYLINIAADRDGWRNIV